MNGNKISYVSVGIGLVLAVSLALNVAYINWGLPDLWHPDEVTRVAAQIYYRNWLNPYFFEYPSLQIYLIYFLVVLPYSLIDPSFDASIEALRAEDSLAAVRFIWSEVSVYARLITAAMGTLCVYMTYRVARLMYGAIPALLAAFFLATSAGFVGLSHFATVDVPQTFWLITCFYLTVRAFKADKAVNYYLAALALGLAVSTKYTAILLLPTLVLAYLIDSDRDVIRLSGFWRKVFSRAMVGIGVAVVLGFVAGTPFAVLTPSEFIEDFGQLLLYQSDYSSTGGKSYIPHLYNLLNASGVFIAVCCVAGFLWGLIRLVREWRPEQFLLVITVVIYYLKMGDVSFHPLRYLVPLLPFLTVLAGKLCFDLFRATSRSRLLNWGWAATFILGASFSLYYATVGVVGIGNDDRVQAYEWAKSNIAPDESVEAGYRLHMPPEFSNVSALPFYHVNPVFVRLSGNERYRKALQTYTRLKGAPVRSPRAIDPDDVIEPSAASLDALLSRKPRYLVIAKLYYDWILGSEEAAQLFPLQFELYSSIVSGSTPYELIEDFERSPSWLRPDLEFIDVGVKVFRYRDDVTSLVNDTVPE